MSRDRPPSGRRDEIRDPVPGAEGRVDPFDDRHVRPVLARDLVRDRGQTLPKRGHQLPSRLRSAAMRADSQDRCEHVIEGARVERNNLGGAAEVVQRLVHVAGRQRADPAQILGEDQLGV
jgi:hypothetical protein